MQTLWGSFQNSRGAHLRSYSLPSLYPSNWRMQSMRGWNEDGRGESFIGGANWSVGYLLRLWDFGRRYTRSRRMSRGSQAFWKKKTSWRMCFRAGKLPQLTKLHRSPKTPASKAPWRVHNPTMQLLQKRVSKNRRERYNRRSWKWMHLCTHGRFP